MMNCMADQTLEQEWAEPWTGDKGNALASELFRSTFGDVPSGVWSAPGRVNLIGEHTDYNGGLSLPTTLRHRTYVAASPRADDSVDIVSSAGIELEGPGERWSGRLDDISPTTAIGWPAYPAGVVWALRDRGYEGPGLNIAIASCVPQGAGLGSSAALTCATALAINGVWKLALDHSDARIELAESAIAAENAIAVTPTGGLDQYTSLFCPDGSAIELDFATSPPGMRPSPLYFPDYGLALLIIDTRKRHDLTDGQYAHRFDECRQAASALGVNMLREVADDLGGLARIEGMTDDVLRRRARHVVTEIDRVRLVAAELAGTAPAHERFIDIGHLMYRSHASLTVDFEVSCPELNLAVEAARQNEALGARLVGGGFGGAVAALVRKTKVASIAHEIDRTFVTAGFNRPRFLYA